MRVAFSGSHRVGKSSLIARVAEARPRYVTVEEPYHLLEDEGYEHGDPPAIEDFVAQLGRSVAAIEEAGPRALFDRCPLDVIAYLGAHEDAEAFELEAWRQRVRDAMRTIDLVVFVPIEVPDRVVVPAHEDRAYRRAVHERLEALVVEDALGCEVDVLVVEGQIGARAAQVLARVRG